VDSLPTGVGLGSFRSRTWTDTDRAAQRQRSRAARAARAAQLVAVPALVAGEPVHVMSTHERMLSRAAQRVTDAVADYILQGGKKPGLLAAMQEGVAEGTGDAATG